MGSKATIRMIVDKIVATSAKASGHCDRFPLRWSLPAVADGNARGAFRIWDCNVRGGGGGRGIRPRTETTEENTMIAFGDAIERMNVDIRGARYRPRIHIV